MSKAVMFSMIAVMAFSAQGAPPLPSRVIPNPVPEAGDNFGRNVAAIGDGLIFTGSAYSTVNNVQAGQAYAFNENTGGLVRTFNHPEPAANTGFGAFIWPGDTRVVISAPGTAVAGHAGAGVIYVFNKSTGAYIRKIANPTPSAGEDFGYGLTMHGDTVLVGSRGDDTDGVDAGIAYRFNAETGAILQTYRIPESSGQDNFGYSLAATGNIVAISAPGSDIEGTNSGRVYVYDVNTGELLHTLKSPNAVTEGNFGFQVRTRGNDILVGAPGEQRAYAFDGNSGQLLQTYRNPLPAPGSVFGSTVGAAGHFVLVGDPHATVAGQGLAGRAYLFKGNSSELVQRYEDPTPGGEQRYGVGVTGGNGNIVISADQEIVNGLHKAGQLYVYPGPVTSAQNWQHLE